MNNHKKRIIFLYLLAGLCALPLFGDEAEIASKEKEIKRVTEKLIKLAGDDKTIADAKKTKDDLFKKQEDLRNYLEKKSKELNAAAAKAQNTPGQSKLAEEYIQKRNMLELQARELKTTLENEGYISK